MTLKKFTNFIYETNVDPFGEDDWEEVDNPKQNDDDYVEDYQGNMIRKDEATWCGFDEKYCHEEDAVWSEREGEYISPDNIDAFVWAIKYRGDEELVHQDDVVYSDKEGGYILMDDGVYCEHDDDACFYENAEELEDGTYGFEENVGEDCDGKKYHMDTLVWDEEKNCYIYDG